ncbi:hypothetical protein SEVIR_8G169966v4 [Setaria viridis]|uniref:CCHC-type domain-containing protein n=2 Tax=Setaria viridis TaxID=4556 RepID=A0A4U6TK19_SETVI|nr:hypothetical protein SEVIR_8G169966v2 [Setaria viridis]TKW01295.1 hypothetical protein SEVIR_8G170350v2 [Setaria viridis]
MQQIRCYMCNQNGHLCCFDFSDNSPKQISCYNCAKSGHSGLGCAKQRRETSAVITATQCYKCGEEGHFARGCTKNAKSDRSKGKSSSHSQRKEKWKKDSSARSAPHDARKTSKRKSPHFEDRMEKPYTNHQFSSGGDYFTPQSSRRHNHGFASPNSNYSPSAKKHGFSSSRFATSNTHLRFERS